MAITTSAPASAVPWYKSLTRVQWNTLIASNLGWMFDGYETYALILTVGPALRQLLPASQLSQLPVYAGRIIAITLVGWAIGGIIGGILADYLGRKKMMMYAVLAYSLTTGLCYFAYSWVSFAVLLLFVGIAIGSEWVTGSSMVAEIWPTAARGKGAGLMQCGFGVGFFVASLLWLFISPLGPGAWRYMYLIGVLPAFLTLWIQSSIEESDAWEKANAERKATIARHKAAGTVDPNPAGFTLFNIFRDPVLRTRTIFVFFMSLTTTVGFWSISTWVPPYIASLAQAAGRQPQTWASYAGMCYTAGSVVGYVTVGFLADSWGRKPVTMVFFAMSLVLTPVLFFWTHDLNMLLLLAFVNAIFSNGQFTWMPVWLPELYPTRVRATALAFAFNAPRFVACFGPILAGTLIVQFGGYGKAAVSLSMIYLVGLAAAPFLPETHGKPLPS